VPGSLEEDGEIDLQFATNIREPFYVYEVTEEDITE
jgi:hypothetical protein